MNLKLIPPPEATPTLIERVGSKLSENAKYLLIGAVLFLVPLAVYNFAIDAVGYEDAVHWGFGTGVVCMLASSYLLYFSGWFIDLDW